MGLKNGWVLPMEYAQGMEWYYHLRDTIRVSSWDTRIQSFSSVTPSVVSTARVGIGGKGYTLDDVPPR
jgi:hypothetical protein